MEAKEEIGVAVRAWAALAELLQAKGVITESERMGVIAKARRLNTPGAGAEILELHCTD